MSRMYMTSHPVTPKFAATSAHNPCGNLHTYENAYILIYQFASIHGMLMYHKDYVLVFSGSRHRLFKGTDKKYQTTYSH